MLKPEEFFSLLSDETRLRCLLLMHARNECCVCDFSYALQIIQPKISRHLAILRGASMVSDRRAGAWIYYSIYPNIPAWAAHLLSAIANETSKLYALDLIRIDERDRMVCAASSSTKEISRKDSSLQKLRQNA